MLDSEPLFVLDAERTAQLAQAENLLIGRCMTEHGFDYLVPEPTTSASSDLAIFGAITVEQAERFGYHRPDAEQLQLANQNAQELAGQIEEDPAIEEALSDCTEDAYAAIYPDGVPLESSSTSLLLLELHNNAMARTLSDDRVGEVNDNWADCMQGYGFDFVVMSDAWLPFQPAPDDTTPPSEAERNTAVADAKCQAESGINELIADLFNAEFAIELNAHPELFEQRRAEVEAALTRANEVLTAERK